MTPHDRSEVRRSVSVGIVVCIWLGALAFYWWVVPKGNSIQFLAGIIVSYLLLWSLAFVLSTESRTEIAQRFLLTSGSVAVVVGLLEILPLAGLVDFRGLIGPPTTEPWSHPDNRLDPKLLHIRRPHYEARVEGVDYRFDQHGFRNEVDLDAADIVVVGDSFIEGARVSAPDLLTSQLARQLGRTVANLAQSWYGPQQELELVRRYGVQLRPKVCVWAFYEGNDLWDVHRYNRVTKNWGEFSKKLHSFGQRSFTRNAVLAIRHLYVSVQNSFGDTKGKGLPSGIFTEANGTRTRMYFLDNSRLQSAADYDALNEVRSILGQAHDECRAAGAKFLVIFIPTKFRVYSGFMKFDADASPSGWVINDLPQKLGTIVRETLPRARFLDLTPLFVEEARQGAVTYFPGFDTHWLPEGHRVAATAIAEVLRKWEK